MMIIILLVKLVKKELNVITKTENMFTAEVNNEVKKQNIVIHLFFAMINQ